MIWGLIDIISTAQKAYIGPQICLQNADTVSKNIAI